MCVYHKYLRIKIYKADSIIILRAAFKSHDWAVKIKERANVKARLPAVQRLVRKTKHEKGLKWKTIKPYFPIFTSGSGFKIQHSMSFFNLCA